MSAPSCACCTYTIKAIALSRIAFAFVPVMGFCERLARRVLADQHAPAF
jgi:hypothetical protein